VTEPEKTPLWVLITAGVGAVLGVGAAIAYAVKGAFTAPPKLVQGDAVVLLGDSLGEGLTPPLRAILDAAGIGMVSTAVKGWNAHQTAKTYLGSDLPATAVVVSLGTNDAAQISPELEAADVQAIVDTAFARGAKRFIWVVPPNYAIPTPPSPATPAKQQAFAALWSDPRVERVEASPAQLAGDDMHLPPAGYGELADQIAAVLL